MAAQNGTLELRGVTGRLYSIDVYLPDAAATQVTFAPNGAASATSPAQMVVPEKCIIEDFKLATAPTAVGVVFQKNSGSMAGGVVRYAGALTSVGSRTKLAIPLHKGDILSGLQI